jgi:predicted nucleic acid-binding Zn ribbon protein
MTHRFDQIKPAHHVTKEECQEMIDAAIRKHNRNASIISMCVGWVVLALFAEGLLRLIGVIDPIFPWNLNSFVMDLSCREVTNAQHPIFQSAC